MKRLKDYREQIHSCSRCGLCQAKCPLYKETGNDCNVARGQFVMLDGVLKKKLKISGTINKYLDICLKCGECKDICPAGLDITDIIITAKSEYFNQHFAEKIISIFQKYLIFSFFPSFINLFKKNGKSEKFEKKVLYFGGCSSKLKGAQGVVKFMNKLGIEVIQPNFLCCGIPLFVRGDLKSYSSYINHFVKVIKKYEIKEILTTCASCEKALKEYGKWAETEEEKSVLADIKIKNIYEYFKESGEVLALKKPAKVTYHKPCNIKNMLDIEYLLKNTANLEYIEMKDFDKCCGLNGLYKLNRINILKNIFNNKKKNIINTRTDYVLTSCLGCETALKTYSGNKYNVDDLIEFISKRI